MPEKTRNYDVLECPWCGHKHKDMWEFGSQEDGEIDCYECSKRFWWSKGTIVSYTGRKPKDKKWIWK